MWHEGLPASPASGAHDLLIAATAQANDRMIATADRESLAGVPGGANVGYRCRTPGAHADKTGSFGCSAKDPAVRCRRTSGTFMG